MDRSRTAALTDLIKGLNAEILIEPYLLTHVDQALTHVSTGRARNLERLEFLGDAVLRLAATEFIDRHHADLSVGACSKLRAQLVSDRWLADVGEALAIEQHLLLGRHAQGDRSAQSRLRADATEALIGALYSALGDLEAIHRWLTPHWQATAQEVLATPRPGVREHKLGHTKNSAFSVSDPCHSTNPTNRTICLKAMRRLCQSARNTSYVACYNCLHHHGQDLCDECHDTHSAPVFCATRV